jgi:apurinic endonuclease APN1
VPRIFANYEIIGGRRRRPVKIGFHVPIAKGFEHTYREAKRLDCDVIQIFVKNPRSWAEKSWSGADREAFGRSLRDLPVVAHLSYLPNIARSDEEPKNLAGFLHEAKLCAELGIETMVVHCGSRESIEKGLDAAAWSVEQVLAAYPLSVLLENAAGQGHAVGKNIPELSALRARVGDVDRVGFCLDTAHLFEAGYDVREPAVWDEIIDEMEGASGPGCIRFFHLNDSKTPLGSSVDRHWHIGKGEIGTGCFRFLLNDERLAHLGGVMETPKMGKMDEENMRVMRSLLSPLVSRPFS